MEARKAAVLMLTHICVADHQRLREIDARVEQNRTERQCHQWSSFLVLSLQNSEMRVRGRMREQVIGRPWQRHPTLCAMRSRRCSADFTVGRTGLEPVTDGLSRDYSPGPRAAVKTRPI